MPPNRSSRNLFILDPNNPDGDPLGGLHLTNGVTNNSIYAMVEIIIILEADYVLQNEHGNAIPRDEESAMPGKYYVVTDGSIAINDEPWLVRTLSLATGPRVAEFKKGVRERDKRCVISGEEVPEVNIKDDFWVGFQAAHVFPLAYEQHWTQEDFGRWITIPSTKVGSINSIQNGMLLENAVHALWDAYAISINPDDNYKIICFRQNRKGIAGKYLDDRFRNDPERPIDQLLRWHFRQAVLANMRGAGEPAFDTDFPPGSDIMNGIITGPRPGERMEFELFSRFAAVGEL